LRTIIAGSRVITEIGVVSAAIQMSKIEITTVICGCAPGVDTLGAEYANLNSIAVEYYPADWDTFGKSAGYKRNEQMAENAEALIAIWDGTSKGTKHMINIAKRKGLQVKVWIYE
jgi:hypothetical protein